jgi:CheY-like chemotaxis protein/HPt (histidine-containing phosphotransfer) domain-containing protein
VGRACQIHSGIASSRGLLLQHSVDPRISPVLVFDPLRVGQILNNFITNALKFTAQGSVTVSVESVSREAGKERLRFTVADTGIGIAREAASHLFEPFSQADVRTATRYGGTGLGLAICKRLAVLMDGSVSLSSEEGAGTRVVLDVAFPVGSVDDLRHAAAREDAPRQLTQKVTMRRLAPGMAEAEAEGRLVLVVDDHPTNRLVLSRQVAALGYGLLMAEDGAEALSLWEQRRIALVLTDCNMPVLNGYDLAREIRERELRQRRTRTPIVACTANALDNEAARCLAAGMDDILIKPVNLVDLMARLDQWLPLPPAEEAPAAPDNGAVIETTVLAGITGGDGAVLREVLLDFRQVNEADLAVLRTGRHADPEQLLLLVHRIQGAARTVGAQRLAGACGRLQQAVRTGEAAVVEEEFARLEQEVAALNAHIDALTTSRAGATAA